MSFFGDITVQDFLDNYWEKKPLLIKNAVPDISEYATCQDLKELSKDEDFESRIVYNNDRGISVTHGPLEDEDFNDTGWTLVTHNLNLLDEKFYNLQKKLDFLPDWLFDDVMATHSQDSATAGAHIDKYNVFITQGLGKRNWELQLDANPNYIEGLEVKILKEFKADIVWVLEPGDMLYIPSGIAHRGTSIGDSISYSLGLKSLEEEIISKAFFKDFAKTIDLENFMKDQTVKPVTDPYFYKKEIVDYFHEVVVKLVKDKDHFSLWMTKYLSTPRVKIETGEIYSQQDIVEISKTAVLKKDVYTKVSALKTAESTVLSINNNLYSLLDNSYLKVSKWFKGSPFDIIKINFSDLNKQEWEVLIDLFSKGTFYFDEA